MLIQRRLALIFSIIILLIHLVDSRSVDSIDSGKKFRLIDVVDENTVNLSIYLHLTDFGGGSNVRVVLHNIQAPLNPPNDCFVMKDGKWRQICD